MDKAYNLACNDASCNVSLQIVVKHSNEIAEHYGENARELYISTLFNAIHKS